MKSTSLKLLPALVLIVSSLVSNPAIAAQPTWCKKPELTNIEATICNDDTLSKADSLLDQMYRAVLSYRGLEGHEGMWPGEIISDQQEFLEKRNKLSTKSDILEIYTTRIKSLTNMLKLRWQPSKQPK